MLEHQAHAKYDHSAELQKEQICMGLVTKGVAAVKTAEEEDDSANGQINKSWQCL